MNLPVPDDCESYPSHTFRVPIPDGAEPPLLWTFFWSYSVVQLGPHPLMSANNIMYHKNRQKLPLKELTECSLIGK